MTSPEGGSSERHSKFDEAADIARAWVSKSEELKSAAFAILGTYRFHTTSPQFLERRDIWKELELALDPYTFKRIPERKRSQLLARRVYLAFMGLTDESDFNTVISGGVEFRVTPLSDPMVFKLGARWPMASGRFLLTDNIVIARTRTMVERRLQTVHSLRDQIIPPLRLRAR